jgi:hypothetical protein
MPGSKSVQFHRFKNDVNGSNSVGWSYIVPSSSAILAGTATANTDGSGIFSLTLNQRHPIPFI